MKKLVIIVTALLFSIGYTASAQRGHEQDNSQGKEQGMMMQKSDMMQGMMENGMCPTCGQMMDQDMPMRKYGMMVNHLPKMQEQLSLSNEQVERLLDLQSEFKKQQTDYQTELGKKQMKLKGLLADNASANQVKNQMEACSETKIKMQLAAYETAGKMKAVLNNNQKEQMKNMMMQKDSKMKDGMKNQQQDQDHKEHHK